ncbi:hypothetical protein DPQ33_13805 [Oceanidesulfovibrio indonesiensis]|uniref:Uncharacterized protein n=1 Tax=Oceanidesulfovibrio indonesiensis TaxID=54767 RepID=A0A7M3MCF3_9BACT|nr:hypothetical protein [Oceanidesulfovibrio indonesiensis]TVM16032.1 hypothetical protein DPQ33_13805 [Oceanidesulfovibrio indonesiensis]
MFIINGSDIASLDDVDLRALVVQLCAAELHALGLPRSSLTAGGDQNAPDGGVDVRVELPSGDARLDFIPRSNTGFQVKKPDMPRGEILNEMRPGGNLRPVIAELAEQGGAYVIACASGSVADSALRDRRSAMRDAVADLQGHDALHLDFYDRERLAAWASQYPGVAVWVQKCLGRPIQGWQPYANWSAPGEPVDAEYLWDDTSRLFDSRKTAESELTIIEGIDRIRDILAKPGGVVRLIGLSGMGKTRLAQALFDARVGERSLDPSIVVYTDTVQAQTPLPSEVIAHHNQEGKRVIVIVDNCKPDLHKTLADACKKEGVVVSLMTVEYDVREDEPEHTEVIRLAPASEDVLGMLLQQRATHVTQQDRIRIAQWSEGNARLALAVARTLRPGESVAAWSDRELFDRLFHQGREEDTSLLRAAEVCSLVYSFDGETDSGEHAELPLLAELAGMSLDELYGHVQELLARELAQQRGKWRAVLPQVLAIHLAKRALEQLRPNRVFRILFETAPPRLRQSFTRRLGHLHDSERARAIVKPLLQPDGMLGDVSAFEPDDATLFQNLAPVLPSETLAALERGLLVSDRAWLDKPYPFFSVQDVSILLHALAYDPELFDRAARLLAKLTTEKTSSANAIGQDFYSLFYHRYSGTHATQRQRISFIEELLKGTVAEAVCGVRALGAMLAVRDLSPAHSYEFGAWPRDYGWRPHDREEYMNWFRNALALALQHIQSDSPVADSLCEMLASQFRDLWVNAQIHDELEHAVEVISRRRYWASGWQVVRMMLNQDSDLMDSDALARLKALDACLKPKNLAEEVRAYVFIDATDVRRFADPVPESDVRLSDAYDNHSEYVRTLGIAVAKESEILSELLGDLSSSGVHESQPSRSFFGQGLAEGAASLTAIWDMLVKGVAATPVAERNASVSVGFLAQAADIDPNAAHTFLDGAIENPALKAFVPLFQSAVGVDSRGVERLIQVAVDSEVEAWNYVNLTFGRGLKNTPPDRLVALVEAVAALPKGQDVALKILLWKLYLTKDDYGPRDKALIECGRRMLLKYPYDGHQNIRTSHDLKEIASICLKDSGGENFAEKLCETFLEAIPVRHLFSLSRYMKILEQIFLLQPHVALTAFFHEKREAPLHYINEKTVLDAIPLETLLGWINEQPEQRFPKVATAIQLFEKDHQSLNPRALELLEAAPDKQTIMARFERRLRPSVWAGSLAGVYGMRKQALAPLLTHEDTAVASVAATWSRKLDEWAQTARESERKDPGSFE